MNNWYPAGEPPALANDGHCYIMSDMILLYLENKECCTGNYCIEKIKDKLLLPGNYYKSDDLFPMQTPVICWMYVPEIPEEIKDKQ